MNSTQSQWKCKLAIYGLRQADNNVYLDKQSCKTI